LTNEGFKLFLKKEIVIKKVIYKRAKERMKEDNDTVTESSSVPIIFYIVGIGGVGLIILGSTLSDWGGWRKYTMLYGAGIIASSILLYAIPNPEEKEFNKVSRIEDPVKRRETAHNALYSLANNARKGRIIVSCGFMGFSTWMLFSDTFKEVPHNKIISIGLLSGSLLNLLVLKSPAENTLKSYLEERKQLKENNQSYRIDLRFGINQYGKGNLNLVLSF